MQTASCPAKAAARLSVRIDTDNPRHHLWNNNGTWWIHYTLTTWNERIRRVRRSLRTKDLGEALEQRDALLRRLAVEGEVAA
jgi:hypothetical protein